jgi:hypothetical protein
MATQTDEITEEKICKLYTDGYGVTELGIMFNLTNRYISKILDKNNIVRYKGRKPSIKYNINFFSSYTPISCYWAGFIYADGCITDKYGVHKVHIGLQKDDENHLIKLAKTINYGGKLYDDISNDAKVLSISGRWYVEDLLKKFNITPQKSLTIDFPMHIPSDMLPHFIRGIFDGDGSITQNENDKGAISVLGTLSTIENIVNYFYDVVGVRINQYGSNNSGKPSIQKIDNVYSVRYHNYNAKMILDCLYNDTTKATRMDRKYENYLEYFTPENMLDKRLRA